MKRRKRLDLVYLTLIIIMDYHFEISRSKSQERDYINPMVHGCKKNGKKISMIHFHVTVWLVQLKQKSYQNSDMPNNILITRRLFNLLLHSWFACEKQLSGVRYTTYLFIYRIKVDIEHLEMSWRTRRKPFVRSHENKK